MPRNSLLAAAFFLALNPSVFAQDESQSMAAGRPGETYISATVANRGIQWESGLSYDDDSDLSVFQFNFSTFKVGIRDCAEVWLDLGGAVANSHAGVSALSLGGKFRFYDGSDFVPAFALVATVTPPVGLSELRPDHCGAFLNLVADNTLPGLDDFDYAFNAGYEFDESLFSFNLYLDYNVSDRLYVFVENNDYIHNSSDRYVNFDCGVAFLPTDNWQLDLSLGHGVGAANAQWSVSAGFVWLIK